MSISQRKLVSTVIEAGQDHEFYPTSQEIIEAMKLHIKKLGDKVSSIIDVGAGGAKVLYSMKEDYPFVEMYAIEKSEVLRQSYTKDVVVIGTEFFNNTLLDKPCDLVFSNPPYSIYEQFFEKIIREGNARDLFLVVPERWENSVPIQNALKLRNADAKVVGSFDFSEAEDRRARAKVDLIHIELKTRNRKIGEKRAKSDPFDLWLEDEFGFGNNVVHRSDSVKAEASADELDGEQSNLGKKAKTAMVEGGNLVDTLYELFVKEMADLMEVYKQISVMNPKILDELDVSQDKIKSAIRLSIKGLKQKYWHELFTHFDKITTRLTKAKRDELLERIQARTSIDFNPSNAHAVVVWVIKNANSSFEEQLIQVFNDMVEAANIELYASNERVYKNDEWRYVKYKNMYDDNYVPPSHFALDYRIVAHRKGGISHSVYSFEQRVGLKHSAADFISDLMVIANNLGFKCQETLEEVTGESGRYKSGKKYVYTYKRPLTGEEGVLFEVKAFQNQNLHFRFGQGFMLAINLEVGRLLGWIHSAEEASEELGEDIDVVKQYIGTNFQLTGDTTLLLDSKLIA